MERPVRSTNNLANTNTNSNTTTANNGNRHQAFARDLSEMDYFVVTGSTDLAGNSKPSVLHQRGVDKSALLDRYEIGKTLGQGSFGTVHFATEKATGRQYASKVMKKRLGHEQAIVQLQREILIMKKVHHPHIVELKEILETQDKVFCIMELCDGGELHRFVRNRSDTNPLSLYEVKVIIARLTDAVSYLHDYGVVHRDIKPENILLQTSNPNDKLNIKLADFGLVAFINSMTMIENKAGTPFYMAPEVFNGQGYSQQCDIWSIGVIAYLLLCGYTEESERMLSDMIVKAKRIEYPSHCFQTIPKLALNFVDLMLQFDPAHRSTAREVLTHPWLTEVTTTEILGDRVVESMDVVQLNVLKKMRAYNAEIKLRKAMVTVWAMARWMKVTAIAQKSKRNSSHAQLNVLVEPDPLQSMQDGPPNTASRPLTTSSVNGSLNSSGNNNVSTHTGNTLEIPGNTTDKKKSAPSLRPPLTLASPDSSRGGSEISLNNSGAMSTSSNNVGKVSGAGGRYRSSTIPSSSAGMSAPVHLAPLQVPGAKNRNSSGAGNGDLPSTTGKSSIPPVLPPNSRRSSVIYDPLSLSTSNNPNTFSSNPTAGNTGNINNSGITNAQSKRISTSFTTSIRSDLHAAADTLLPSTSVTAATLQAIPLVKSDPSNTDVLNHYKHASRKILGGLSEERGGGAAGTGMDALAAGMRRISMNTGVGVVGTGTNLLGGGTLIAGSSSASSGAASPASPSNSRRPFSLVGTTTSLPPIPSGGGGGGGVANGASAMSGTNKR